MNEDLDFIRRGITYAILVSNCIYYVCLADLARSGRVQYRVFIHVDAERCWNLSVRAEDREEGRSLAAHRFIFSKLRFNYILYT